MAGWTQDGGTQGPVAWARELYRVWRRARAARKALEQALTREKQ